MANDTSTPTTTAKIKHFPLPIIRVEWAMHKYIHTYGSTEWPSDAFHSAPNAAYFSICIMELKNTFVYTYTYSSFPFIIYIIYTYIPFYILIFAWPSNNLKGNAKSNCVQMGVCTHLHLHTRICTCMCVCMYIWIFVNMRVIRAEVFCKLSVVDI